MASLLIIVVVVVSHLYTVAATNFNGGWNGYRTTHGGSTADVLSERADRRSGCAVGPPPLTALASGAPEGAKSENESTMVGGNSDKQRAMAASEADQRILDSGSGLNLVKFW